MRLFVAYVKIREELFGADGIDSVAKTFNLPVATWKDYEHGVTIPGEVLLAFVVAFGINPNWLLTGEGERLTSRDASRSHDYAEAF